MLSSISGPFLERIYQIFIEFRKANELSSVVIKAAEYTDYMMDHAIKSYENRLESGEELLTLIFWNQDEGSEWLTIVAGKCR